jgi:hypothetical protein
MFVLEDYLSLTYDLNTYDLWPVPLNLINPHELYIWWYAIADLPMPHRPELSVPVYRPWEGGFGV